MKVLKAVMNSARLLLRKTSKVIRVPIVAMMKNRLRNRLRKRVPARRTSTTVMSTIVPKMKLGPGSLMKTPASRSDLLPSACPRVAKLTARA
jgi:hypothetical protein